MILFVFICKRFFQLISFMYETELKGHDGIAVYKSLHFSADFIGNFPEVGEMHVDGGCHMRWSLRVEDACGENKYQPCAKNSQYSAAQMVAHAKGLTKFSTAQFDRVDVVLLFVAQFGSTNQQEVNSSKQNPVVTKALFLLQCINTAASNAGEGGAQEQWI